MRMQLDPLRILLSSYNMVGTDAQYWWRLSTTVEIPL